jgi:predicted transcriptional regulator of viral defense system
VALIDRTLEYVQRSGETAVRAADVAMTLHVAEDHAATMLSKLVRRKKIIRASRGLYLAKDVQQVQQGHDRMAKLERVYVAARRLNPLSTCREQGREWDELSAAIHDLEQT